jgi:hypothetical protein
MAAPTPGKPNRLAVMAGIAIVFLGMVGGIAEISFDHFPSPGAFLAVFGGALFVLMLVWRWLFRRN